MPSAPPGDTDEERWSGDGDRPGADAAVAVATESPFGPQVLSLFDSESGVDGPGDARRSARLLHEMAHHHDKAGRPR